LAICLLTDYVACNDAATLQVGERSRRIHPAGLLTRTLADAVGQDVAMDLHLSEKVVSATEACEIGLVQAVVTSVRNAQLLAHDLVRRLASLAEPNARSLLGGVWLIRGELPRSDRRILALDAFAQAQSAAEKAPGERKAPDVVYASSGDPLTRIGVRKVVHAAALQTGHDGRSDDHRSALWKEVVYELEESQPKDPPEDALTRLLRMLTEATADQRVTAAATTHSMPEPEAPSQAYCVEVTPLAARFTAEISKQPDANALATLMRAYVEPAADMMQSESGVDEPQPWAVDATFPCLLMLRHGSGVTGSQPPLVIAHSLLGDHRCRNAAHKHPCMPRCCPQ
jgi:enoyl-CoA hydratase/carnithine racemase